MKHGREIVAPPENKAANSEHKHQPTLQRLQTTNHQVADRPLGLLATLLAAAGSSVPLFASKATKR